VWLWDARHARWDAAGVDATYSQHDTLALGQILARHISTNGTVRVRVSADRTHAWVRGLQLVSDVECGKPNRVTASRVTLAAELKLPPDASDVPDALHALTVDRSDAYTVQLEAEVLRGNEVIARRQGLALLAREWEADGADLRPTVRIERWQPTRF
jgi:hypothetical protein